jgi:hypothetical protein
MTDIRTGSSGRAGTRPRHGSPGLPAVEENVDERIAELEARLARLESTTGLRERGRTMLDKVMPPEASHHFRNAGREHLLGVRTIVDHWIRRIDSAEAHASASPPRDRETIEIE